MKRKWQHAALALALAGVAILVPIPASARQTHPSYPRQERAKMRREIRQDKHQIRQQRHHAQANWHQLRTSRRQYATGKQQKVTLRSDFRQAKQNANAVRREGNQQIHLHSNQVLHEQKPKKK